MFTALCVLAALVPEPASFEYELTVNKDVTVWMGGQRLVPGKRYALNCTKAVITVEWFDGTHLRQREFALELCRGKCQRYQIEVPRPTYWVGFNCTKSIVAAPNAPQLLS